jgi:hypothetical protein
MPAARATTDARPAAEIGWSNSGGESVEIYAAIGQFCSLLLFTRFRGAVFSFDLTFEPLEAAGTRFAFFSFR